MHEGHIWAGEAHSGRLRKSWQLEQTECRSVAGSVLSPEKPEQAFGSRFVHGYREEESF